MCLLANTGSCAFSEFVATWAAARPDAVAISADGHDTTWRRLWNRVERATARLQGEWGVGSGDRVAYLGLNRAEEITLLCALARLGAILVPLNIRLAEAELRDILRDCDARVLVADTFGEEMAVALTAGAPALVVHQLDALITEPCGHVPVLAQAHGDAPLLLAYTSGTSGRPKGVLHSVQGIRANARASIAAHGLTQADHVLTVLPMFHVGGLCIQTLPALMTGARVTLHGRFDAGAWLNAVMQQRPTLSLMVPATLRAVIEHPDWEATDLSSLRMIMAGSSVIPVGFLERFHARGIPVGQVYGATETGPVSIVLGEADAMRRTGYAGWPARDVAVRLVAPDGTDSNDGQVGEIWLRAPNLMLGYWNRPVSEAFMDGWFRTGDLACRDPDGCLRIVGRAKDMIISGGENIYPAEIEHILAEIPGIAEVAVVGVPDPRWGEACVAVVVLAAGAALNEAVIAQALDGRVARYKHPRQLRFVAALPRNVMGKVVKGELVRMIDAGLAG